MATLEEQIQIVSLEIDGALNLQRKIQSAMQNTAALILDDGDTGAPFSQDAGKHELRVKWANLVLLSNDETIKMFRAAVGFNPSATQAQILAAGDTVIQDTVNELVDGFSAVL